MRFLQAMQKFPHVKMRNPGMYRRKIVRLDEFVQFMYFQKEWNRTDSSICKRATRKDGSIHAHAFIEEGKPKQGLLHLAHLCKETITNR